MIYWSKIAEENLIVSILIRFFVNLIVLVNKISKHFSKPNKRILIISFHKLGDTVFTIPTIEKIIQHNTNLDVYLFCMENTSAIYKAKFVDSVKYITCNANEFIFGDRIAGASVRKKIKKLNPSIIIDLTGSPKSATSFLFNKADQVIGFNRLVFKKFYTNFNVIRNISHICQIYSESVSGFVNIDTETITEWFSAKRKNSGLILIHPFAGWPSKEWGLKNFVDLAVKLNEVKETALIVPSGSLANEIKEEINLLGLVVIETISVSELISQIKKAFMVIGNDSGAVNLANLVGVPNFTIFGPSNPSFHFINSENSSYINQMLPCSPAPSEKLCFTNGGRDGCPDNLCLKTVKVEEVFKKILKLI